MDDSHEAQRRDALRMLLRYDPEGIAVSIEGAESMEELLQAVGQLAHLVTLITAAIMNDRD